MLYLRQIKLEIMKLISKKKGAGYDIFLLLFAMAY
jgi:hypothetical protein